jgi:hypothetical protein
VHLGHGAVTGSTTAAVVVAADGRAPKLMLAASMLLVLSASMFLPVTQSMPQMAEEMLPTPLLLRTLTAFSRAGGDPDDAEAVVLGGHRTGDVRAVAVAVRPVPRVLTGTVHAAGDVDVLVLVDARV